MSTHNILILPSEDGQEYAYAVLYPSNWTPEQADELATDAFTAAQQTDPNEWSWDNIEPELIARGFLCVDWHHGPVWDEQRVKAS